MTSIATLLVLVMTLPAVADTVGVRRIAISVPERNAVLHATLWDPAVAGGQATLVGGNAVFRGTPALKNAPPRDGHFPLILIAFGGLRAAPDLGSWLASTMASNGFVAAVINPPPIPHGRAEQSVLGEFWLRPGDLSAAITAIESEPSPGDRIDTKQLGGVGFFLGGYAMLALAGGRVDAAGFEHSCETNPTGPDCAWFAKGGVNLHLVDAARLSRSNLDPRLKAAIVVDPELNQIWTSSSLTAISVPVHIINVGLSQSINPPLSAARLAANIPGSHYSTIAAANPFSLFPQCRPNGAAVLKGDGGEVQLCNASGVQSRAKIHARLASIIIGDLRESFSKH